ncbi:MAG: hypothetical protein QOJ35_597 [Solirubrobacteraceae bacterium]|nr:hypothetical protein [Solirubrobacteraceae bacterium]
MRTDPATLLRGLVKLVVVVAAAALVGEGVGIGLAKLSGSDAGAAQALSSTTTATSAAAPTTQAQAPPTTTAATTTAAPSAANYTAPRVEVLSAQLGPRSASTGRALVSARVRVTNRTRRPLVGQAPTLLSVQDEVPVNDSGSAAPNALLRTLAPGASATGVLRFTLPSPVAQRLTAKPAARLGIAGRIVALKLTKVSR